MRKTKHILLASHGTKGARAAEKTALALCDVGSVLHHLIVVPDLWKGMMGDDWLNNASTRDVYARYVESELEAEIRGHMARLQRRVTRRRARYRPEVVIGKPAECLVARSRRSKIDLVVIGSARPRGHGGLRSRMLTEKAITSLPVALLIVPHPDA